MRKFGWIPLLAVNKHASGCIAKGHAGTLHHIMLTPAGLFVDGHVVMGSQGWTTQEAESCLRKRLDGFDDSVTLESLVDVINGSDACETSADVAERLLAHFEITRRNK